MFIKNNWFDILRKHSIDDIEYFYGYSSLYGNPEMFLMENDKMSAFIIFIYDEKSRSFESPYGYGSFWTNTDDKEFFDIFFASFKEEMLKRNCVAGLIRYNPFVIIPKTSVIENEFVRDIVYIDLKDDFSANYSKRTLGDIKRAGTHKLDFDFSASTGDLKLFGNLYRDVMKLKHASEELVFTDDYFKRLSTLDKAFVVTAKRENELIGGAVFLFSRHTSYYHLSAVKNKKDFPGLSGLLLNLGIEHAHKSKSEKMILGGGMTSAEDDSLLFFKEGFSNLKKQFIIGKMIVNDRDYKSLTGKYDETNPNKAKLFLRYKLYPFRLQSTD
ncbi:TPA: hypothetical protein DCW38_06395 [candidate division WOR-3 bacterium]|uniref:BioF2-like acetyltransferase domain-containing protein n=1 Tax=candidate division WOR-3 bacterium TaxID=2052148 RepID=A0A350HB76_UNCW3|nr:hypothetical protein [candidate division WOR-3 bacterium]